MKKTEAQRYSEFPAWKKKMHVIIFGVDTPEGKIFDVILLIAIFGSLILIMLESVQSINARYDRFFYYSEWILTLLFTAEYILRLTSAIRPARYATSIMGIVDLLAILPTFLSLFLTGAGSLMAVRAIRLIRIFRIFKLTHFMGGASQISNALLNSRHKIIVFLGTVVCATTVMGAFMYTVEGGENGFTSIPRSIYWAIVTVTTVGYGDIIPQTALGQALASCLMVIGYAILAVPTGIVTAEMTRSSSVLRKCHNCEAHITLDNATYCHICGMELTE